MLTCVEKHGFIQRTTGQAPPQSRGATDSLDEAHSLSTRTASLNQLSEFTHCLSICVFQIIRDHRAPMLLCDVTYPALHSAPWQGAVGSGVIRSGRAIKL
jgi:hypothetical protein